MSKLDFLLTQEPPEPDGTDVIKALRIATREARAFISAQRKAEVTAWLAEYPVDMCIKGTITMAQRAAEKGESSTKVMMKMGGVRREAEVQKRIQEVIDALLEVGFVSVTPEDYFHDTYGETVRLIVSWAE